MQTVKEAILGAAYMPYTYENMDLLGFTGY